MRRQVLLLKTLSSVGKTLLCSLPPNADAKAVTARLRQLLQGSLDTLQGVPSPLDAAQILGGIIANILGEIFFSVHGFSAVGHLRRGTVCRKKKMLV